MEKVNSTENNSKEDTNEQPSGCSADKGTMKEQNKSPLQNYEVRLPANSTSSQGGKIRPIKHSTRYIRNEALHPAGFNHDNRIEMYSMQQSLHRDNKERQCNAENNVLDESLDVDLGKRCMIYMSGLKCHKGDYCEKLHRFPREDKIVCKHINGEGCSRPVSECWFWHPGNKVKYVPDENAPVLVPSMGDTMKYIRNNLLKKSK